MRILINAFYRYVARRMERRGDHFLMMRNRAAMIGFHQEMAKYQRKMAAAYAAEQVALSRVVE